MQLDDVVSSENIEVEEDTTESQPTETVEIEDEDAEK